MSAPTMEQVEVALHSWAQMASGFPASKIIWRRQAGPWPARPFIVLDVGDSQSVGSGWSERTDTVSPQPGGEITYRARGQERLRASFDVITDVTTTSQRAMAVLQRIRGYLRLPSVRDLLSAASMGVASFGPINVLDALHNKTQQLSRAQMDCFIYLPTEFTEVGTFIETEDHTVNALS